MTIPDFQTLMLPALKYAATRPEHGLRQAVDFLATEFGLTEEERAARLPSGKQPIFYNRVGWARTYLKQARLLEPSGKPRSLRITERGKEVLASQPARVDMHYLERFPEYVEFRDRIREPGEEAQQVQAEERPIGQLTPEESLEAAYRKTRDELAKELLDNIVRSTSAFFEQLVVELLVAMGYGGSIEEAARAVGQSGDEGIDGIIDEDKLGLDSIYVQAKRWSDRPVGRDEIQRFVGALEGKRARKGIFITTSRFTDQAREYAGSIDKRVVLIDARRLTELMMDYRVGVTTETVYEIRRLDSDYFTDILD